MVTEARGGICGAALCYMVSHGADVIASGRDEDKFASLADETGCSICAFDLGSGDSLRGALVGRNIYSLVDFREFRGEIATPIDTDIDVFNKLIAVNVHGALLATKDASCEMIRLGPGGSIVNVSSQASWGALKGHIFSAPPKLHWIIIPAFPCESLPPKT